MNIWFASFLFGGFLIALEDMYWPFKLFYYTMPYSYYARSALYIQFTETNFKPCDGLPQPVCVPAGADGKVDSGEVLDSLGRVFPLIESSDEVGKDMGILLAIAMVYKIGTILGIMVKSKKVAAFKSA